MRYSSAILVAAAALASASDSAQSMHSCIDGCNNDLNCKAHCVPVPNPSNQQALDTNRCVGDCPKNEGPEKSNKCRMDCIEKYYFKPGEGTPKDGDRYHHDGDHSGDNNNSNDDGDNNDNDNDNDNGDNNDDDKNGWPWNWNNPNSNDGGSGGTTTDKVNSDTTATASNSPSATAAASGLVSGSAAVFAAIAALFSL
ncbi:hypothetical protein K4F52_007311 [Lecanicillium sp. MT-2017a]|nr:hypothetical protein K4F52_007311 [Lecanicillium sp. MT-2017a]